MPDVRLHLGDCLDVMREMPDNSVDAIVTDLPYGTTACKWDEVIPFAPMWEQVKRVLKPRCAFVTTASQPFTSALVMSNPEWFRHCWVWNKRLSGNFLLAKKQPLKIHEDVCVFSENGHTYNPQMRKGLMRTKGGGGYSKLWQTALTSDRNSDYYPLSIVDVSNANRDIDHPTQKPVALYEYLIRTYTNAGDTVLDFCFGSGTTGVACVQTGRNFIGVEIDEGYFKIAERRIAQAQAQPPLIPHEQQAAPVQNGLLELAP